MVQSATRDALALVGCALIHNIIKRVVVDSKGTEF